MGDGKGEFNEFYELGMAYSDVFWYYMEEYWKDLKTEIFCKEVSEEGINRNQLEWEQNWGRRERNRIYGWARCTYSYIEYVFFSLFVLSSD